MAPAWSHKPNHEGSSPSPATNLITDFMDLKIETEDFIELCILRDVELVPRVGEYILCKEGTFEVTKVRYTIDSRSIFYTHIKVKSTNILQF